MNDIKLKRIEHTTKFNYFNDIRYHVIDYKTKEFLHEGTNFHIDNNICFRKDSNIISIIDEWFNIVLTYNRKEQRIPFFKTIEEVNEFLKEIGVERES